jgi:hypothetical protein
MIAGPLPPVDFDNVSPPPDETAVSNVAFADEEIPNDSWWKGNN